MFLNVGREVFANEGFLEEDLLVLVGVDFDFNSSDVFSVEEVEVVFICGGGSLVFHRLGEIDCFLNV